MKNWMRMIGKGRWASSCGSGKGELVIMMLERVAQLMRVRQKKEVGTSSGRAGLLVITSNGINIYMQELLMQQ